ncbi:MAG: thiol reductant ABC exporter subunit CydC [Candidatus Promineifilaceae bacterium]|nr:thiol reductant ABC exporter subunit CydC [Candidatus Promineifilaceae bacterium]
MKTLPRLLQLLVPFRWWIALAVLLSFATIGTSVGLIAMSAYLLSKAALTTFVVDLSLAITGVRFFAIARAALRYTERYITHRTTFQILTYLRTWFYSAIEPLAPARLLVYRSGDLLTRIMADIETLENFYIRVVVPPLAAALVTAVACAILGLFNVWLAVVLFIFLFLTGLVLPLISGWLARQPNADMINTRAELNATLVDEIQGLADVLAFGQAEQYQTRTQQLTRELNLIQERLALMRGLGDTLGILFTGLAALSVLWLAIPLVTGGSIDGVYLALLPLTAIAAFEAVQPLSQAWQLLEESRAAGKRLFDLIDAPPAVLEPVDPAPPPANFDLDIQNLSFRYASDQPYILTDLNLKLAHGERVGIIGPSGVGKTTLINLLVRFWDYEEGHIYLAGQELRDYKADDVRRVFAVVSQNTHLFNSTIRDNLRLAKADAGDADIEAACRMAQIHEFIMGLPLGYGTMIGENGLLLSGGERQRLALARAILKDAPIIILDEATAHLDAMTQEAVLGAFNEFSSGRSLITIAHDQPIHALCDRILILKGGRLVPNDTIADPLHVFE